MSSAIPTFKVPYLLWALLVVANRHLVHMIGDFPSAQRLAKKKSADISPTRGYLAEQHLCFAAIAAARFCQKNGRGRAASDAGTQD